MRKRSLAESVLLIRAAQNKAPKELQVSQKVSLQIKWLIGDPGPCAGSLRYCIFPLVLFLPYTQKLGLV